MITSGLNPKRDLQEFERATALLRRAAATRSAAYVHYPFKPPFLFDCRLRRDGRRMGIGDQIVVIGVLQAIAARVEARIKPQNLIVWYDADYPAARALWEASGLMAAAVPGGYQMERADGDGCTVISLRHHFLEDPLGHTTVCDYGEEQGYPGDQLLHNLGWHELVQCRPMDIHLMAEKKVRESAAEYLLGLYEWHGAARPYYITANFIQVTRGQAGQDLAQWRATLQSIAQRARETGRTPIVLWGCSPAEEEHLESLGVLQLADVPSRITTGTLPFWLDLIRRADHHVTANTAGMWLGFATRTPMTILSATTTAHGRMWEPKPHWFAPEHRAIVHLVGS